MDAALNLGRVKSRTSRWLQKIPTIAVQIFEHRNDAVTFFPRLFAESDALVSKGFPIAPKIVRVEKQEHSAPCLISHSLRL